MNKCAYCKQDSGFNHQPGCPNAPASSDTVEPLDRPDRGGFWWMNAPSEFGWEPVEVVYSHGCQKVYRLGRSGEPFDIPASATQWIRLTKPNTPAAEARR